MFENLQQWLNNGKMSDLDGETTSIKAFCEIAEAYNRLYEQNRWLIERMCIDLFDKIPTGADLIKLDSHEGADGALWIEATLTWNTACSCHPDEHEEAFEFPANILYDKQARDAFEVELVHEEAKRENARRENEARLLKVKEDQQRAERKAEYEKLKKEFEGLDK
jgi:hypothetical protein